MPDLAPYHPIVVHFAIALLFVGVPMRLLSLWPRARSLSTAALILIAAGTLASVVAVASGEAAHGPAERIPGANEAVHEHEEYGEAARTVFLVVLLLEVGALAVGSAEARRRLRTGLYVASGVVGLFGLFQLYEAGEHGGDLVYRYAGGVGTRSGAPEDVERLLLAGLYHQAQADRAAGRNEEAARLVEEMARRFGDDPAVRVLAAESLLRDRGDAAAALEALRAIDPGESRRTRFQVGMLTAEAFEALEQPDSARAALEELREEFPDSRRVQEALERLGG